ncbi:restriction endonuclease [Mycolicibacterium smegmatis]|uniref:McrC family protein n=1 Tax=Mycolicibacterium smegmatis TaxID=1772 RepID=UPI0005DA2576|nr:restriction endonuclease [Mycolicibacterium smegmatis]MDF1903573.1 restriction endonuclease [Mycolicibacterium smegmatis]MDF1910099.1 restriction endonuclease [Mycolicibacterium smegmatis]MDF1921946.1 restriction endonuclease [Mycolicibacterium smegmatis]MDF1928464.1 restriction endonuclease [Mycolicibacterium smegmatis]UAK53490.1 McrC family protein [Mycolicibacterium smegmatis]
MPTPLILTEGGPAQTVALTGAEYRALNDLGIATVTPTLDDGHFDIVAARKVGAVTVGNHQIIVRPKITNLNRVLFMLGYARNPQIWRDEPIRVEAADELLPAVAEAFSRIASHAVEQGLLQGYRTITDALPVLRGRVLAGEQMSRRYGLPVPIAVQYDDFTVDIAENQLLAMATLRLLTVPRISDPARRSLQRLRRTLGEVSVPPPGTPTPRWHPSRLNVRYHAALRLAEIILAAESFEHRIGNVTVTGYMFDMWKIFEDFVTTALSESLNRLGWRCQPQAPLYLDEQRRVGMQPDLLCRYDDSRVAVVDAKYKAERPEGFPNADLYQMLAYCTVLSLPEGHLIYAKGNEKGRVHTVQRSGVTIHCRALDLGLDPAALLRQVDQLAVRIAKTGALADRKE